MPIRSLRNKSPDEVTAAIAGFSSTYLDDWSHWLSVSPEERPPVLGKLLRKWQATRPNRMRRCRNEADHDAPYLEDLVERATPLICDLGALDMLTFSRIREEQRTALLELWRVFEQLPVLGTASCVGITKAVMLLTDGRIGPALDSQVRRSLGIGKPETPEAWIQVLRDVADDITEFESRWGVRLPALAPERCRHLEYGRLYDMAFGPQ